MPHSQHVESAFRLACERYQHIGVDVAEALRTLRGISISVHCWQGDDVIGFENSGRELGSGWRSRAIIPAVPEPSVNSATIWKRRIR